MKLIALNKGDIICIRCSNEFHWVTINTYLTSIGHKGFLTNGDTFKVRPDIVVCTDPKIFLNVKARPGAYSREMTSISFIDNNIKL